MTHAEPKRQKRMALRLSEEHKRLIEDAATLTGMPVSAFAISTLVETAREVIATHGHTRLSKRDARRFAILDEEKPTAALKKAAARYKARHGR